MLNRISILLTTLVVAAAAVWFRLPSAEAAAPPRCEPTITFTVVPAWGTTDNLTGQVDCASPDDYKVAVYIWVWGWWNKPTWANPLTTIQADGSFTTDITGASSDSAATALIAFLVPAAASVPLLDGDQSFPNSLWADAVTYTHIERPERTIQFSGYEWVVKSADVRAGPGPNYFSNDEQDVYVDEQGRLHMHIVERDGRWHSSEVYLWVERGFGRYEFEIASPTDTLDENIIVGLFTYDSLIPDHAHREIDVELSRWGQEDNDNAQFVVQPYTTAGNIFRFNTTLTQTLSTHVFDWRASQISFESTQGATRPADVLGSWTYTGADVPPAGDITLRINFWLMWGNAPTDGQSAELIINSFQFTPETTTATVLTNVEAAQQTDTALWLSLVLLTLMTIFAPLARRINEGLRTCSVRKPS